MDFGLSEEQVLLKDSIDGFLKTRAPLDRTRAHLFKKLMDEYIHPACIVYTFATANRGRFDGLSPEQRAAQYARMPLQRQAEYKRDGVEEALIKVADSYIQLTAATRDDSPIAKAIEKRGEGLHHVGYRVDDCAAALAAMVAAGATAIDKEPRPGSRGTTVAFVHPKGSFGTLIELVQE